MPRQGRRGNVVKKSRKDSTSSDSDINLSSDSCGTDSASSKPRYTRRTTRRLVDASSDDSATNATQPSKPVPKQQKNKARKSTATRPIPGSSNRDNDNSSTRNKASASTSRISNHQQIQSDDSDEIDTTLTRKIASASISRTSNRRQVQSDDSDDTDLMNPPKSKSAKVSQQNKTSTALPQSSNRLTRASSSRQLSFGTTKDTSKDENSSQKRSRPPHNLKSSDAIPSTSRSTPSNTTITSTVSDDSSDENIIQPTPGARSGAVNHFSPKRIGTYSPVKGITRDVKMQYINNCVQYLLIADQKKYSIKRTDIRKNVFKDSISAKDMRDILCEANKILKQVFGLELIELEKEKHHYMIQNNLLDALEFAEYSDNKLAERGLIIYLLTLIFMSENSISEDNLWKSLKPFGLIPDAKKLHPVFGDVRRFITQELVRQMYLEYKKIDNTEPIQHQFLWGLRAKQEVKKLDLLNLTCEAYGDCNPMEWLSQYKDANEQIDVNLNN